MKLAALILFLVCSNLNAVIYCCCDDDENTLSDIAQAFQDLKDETDDAKDSLADRMSDYDELLKKDKGKQTYNVMKLNATNMYRESLNIKESFEAHAASVSIDDARVSNSLAGAVLREDIGDEAKNFFIKNRQ